MKKFALLFVAVLTAGLTSCSKDDDNAQASLVGKWEYSKEGVSVNGIEQLENYDHSTGCDKDFSMITATAIIDHTFEGSGCTEFLDNYTYTRSGNTITVTDDEGGVQPFQILQLDNSTLKTKTSVSIQGTTFDYITVYTRR